MFINLILKNPHLQEWLYYFSEHITEIYCLTWMLKGHQKLITWHICFQDLVNLMMHASIFRKVQMFC